MLKFKKKNKKTGHLDLVVKNEVSLIECKTYVKKESIDIYGAIYGSVSPSPGFHEDGFNIVFSTDYI